MKPSCLKILDSLREDDQKAISDKIDEYVKLADNVGIGGRNEIAKRAVNDYLAELKAEHADILKQAAPIDTKGPSESARAKESKAAQTWASSAANDYYNWVRGLPTSSVISTPVASLARPDAPKTLSAPLHSVANYAHLIVKQPHKYFLQDGHQPLSPRNQMVMAGVMKRQNQMGVPEVLFGGLEPFYETRHNGQPSGEMEHTIYRNGTQGMGIAKNALNSAATGEKSHNVALPIQATHEGVHNIDTQNSSGDMASNSSPRLAFERDSSGIAQPKGDIATQAMIAFSPLGKSAVLRSFLRYPLEKLNAGGAGTMPIDVAIPELFAQLGAVYYHNPELLKQEIPAAYQQWSEVHDAIRSIPIEQIDKARQAVFDILSRQPNTGLRVPGHAATGSGLSAGVGAGVGESGVGLETSGGSGAGAKEKGQGNGENNPVVTRKSQITEGEKEADRKFIIDELTMAERKKLTLPVAKKFVNALMSMPSSKEAAAVAWAGRAKRGWYRQSALALHTVFGKDAPRFAALLAAMSPQTSVEMNLANTLPTWINWNKAGRPTARKDIIEIMGRSVTGNKLTESILPAWINNSVRALTHPDPGALQFDAEAPTMVNGLVMSGPKVNSFFQNLIGNVNELTNDSWMAAWSAVDQRLFSGSLNKTGTEPGKRFGYLAMNAILRRAARHLTSLTGETWTPAEIQETIWSWAKALYEQSEKAGKSNLDFLREGHLTDALINATPDFGTLLNEGTFGDALRNGGYAEQVQRLGEVNRANVTRHSNGEPSGSSEKTPFAGSTQDRLTGQAAARLDQRRSRLANAKWLSTADAAKEGDAVWDDFKEDSVAAMQKPGWATISATRSAKGAWDSPANITANNVLESTLRNAGIEYKKGVGYWQGVKDGPAFLIFTNEKSALALAERFKQEAIATSKGYQYTDGRLIPADHATSVEGPEAKSRPGYTSFPGGPTMAMGMEPEKTTRQSQLPAEDRSAVVSSDKLRGDGRGFTDFFTEASKGNRAPDKSVPYTPTLDISHAKSYSDEYVKHRGNFDDHIATSIPAFREVQQAAGHAIVQSYPHGANVLDIAASEGAFNKAITAESGGKIKTLALDPNEQMAKFFREHSKVPGATYDMSAFGSAEDAGKLAWTEDNGTPIHTFNPDKKFDVVHEAMGFQFISNSRNAQFARVKEMMNPDGIAIFDEKIKEDTPQWALNEKQKDAYKARYFTAKQLADKKAEVLEKGEAGAAAAESKREQAIVGMNDLMTTGHELETSLLNNWKHVSQYWDSGNFKGFVASDSREALDKFLSHVGDMNSEFSTVETPRDVVPTKVTRASAHPFDDTHRSPEPKEGWYYSALERSVIQKAPWGVAGDMPAVQLSKWLTSNAGKLGIKSAEMQWSGINDWLTMSGGKVTREQVQQFLDQNGVKVTETMLDDSDMSLAKKQKALYDQWRTAENKENILRGRASDSYGTYGKSLQAEAAAKLPAAVAETNRLRALYTDAREAFVAQDREERRTRFNRPDLLLPGGKNYRELLLTLPYHSASTTDIAFEKFGQPYRNLTELQQVMVDRYSLARSEKNGPEFRASHFAQPNILAHIRFNERTDANGKKVLFIEELQSDWAQQGRKHGFSTGELRPGEKVEELKDDDGSTMRWEFTSADGFVSSGSTREAAIKRGRSDENGTGIPNAPFVGKTEAWVALALKRMIRYAADNGFDRIAWTNGEQQASRYDLSKQVDGVKVQINDDGTRTVSVDAHGNKSFIHMDVGSDGKVTFADSQPELQGKALDEVIGKDMADKVMSEDRDRTFRGVDLKVGGEGMKSFYDKIVPNVANDVLKKLGGGRVGDVDFDGTFGGTRTIMGGVESNIDRQPGFDITPFMRKAALGGQTLFSEMPPEKTTRDSYHTFEGTDQPERKRAAIAASIQKLVAPASRGKIAEQEAGIMRSKLAEQARASVLAEEQFHSFGAMFNTMPREANYRFINDYEKGRQQPTPELQRAADAIRAFNDSRREAIQNLGTGKLQEFDDNYLGRIWKQPERAAAFFGRRPLEGSRGFLKQRTFQYFVDGINHGLEPITDNPIEMMLLKGVEQDRYIYAQRIIAEMHSAGLTQLVPYGELGPDGWTKINDKIAAAGSAGVYWAPDEAATLINNHLSPGMQGNGVYDIIRQAGNMLNSVQLGLSAFHVGFTTLDAMVSKGALGVQKLSRGQILSGVSDLAQSISPTQPFMNLYKGDKLFRAYLGNTSDPQVAAILDAFIAGGGRARLDAMYRNQNPNALKQAMRRSDYWTAATKTIPSLLDLINKPIFEYIVPRQKMGVFFDMASDWLQRNPNATVEQTRVAMGKFVDSIDNRLGQMTYDNLFLNRTVKDALFVSFRSVGWNWGTYREIGGGIADIRKIRADKELSTRTAYIFGLTFVVGVYGAILSYLMTGHGPDNIEGLYNVKTGRIRPDGTEDMVQLPSYMKDIFAYKKDLYDFAKYGSNPTQTLTNKMHPLIGLVADLMSNKDFFGAAIQSPGDSAGQRLQDIGSFVAKQASPFGIRNYIQQQKVKGAEPSVLGYLTSPAMVGITPAPGYITKSDKQEEASVLGRMKDGLIAKFRQELKDGATPADITRRAANAGLKPAEITMLLHQGLRPQKPRSESSLRHLSDR